MTDEERKYAIAYYTGDYETIKNWKGRKPTFREMCYWYNCTAEGVGIRDYRLISPKKITGELYFQCVADDEEKKLRKAKSHKIREK